MIGIAVLSAFIGVVAVSLECEVAALVFLGVAYGVGTVSSVTWGHGGLVGARVRNEPPFP
jgi:hypothetical protein